LYTQKHFRTKHRTAEPNAEYFGKYPAMRSAWGAWR